jgi:lysophospholipase L1-like esterase
MSRRLFAGTLLAVAGILFALAACELVLRLAGFTYHTFPTVQFGWPEPAAMADVFAPDRDLFWVPKDYAAQLRDARTLQPAVVFVGDSCTQFGTWPRLTLDRLRGGAAPELARGVKLGVAGWSTVQGLAQLERDILPLNARIVVIFFGWNDHWAAFGRPDTEARAGAVTWWLSEHSRVMQAWLKARQGAELRLSPDAPVRVDLASYESNLRRMARDVRGAGARAVLITAPSGHVKGQEPAYLTKRHVRRLEDVVPLHAAYVDATRRAARAEGAALCDAAYAFSQLPPPLARYFQHDGIHFSDEGNARLAEIVSACLIETTGAVR